MILDGKGLEVADDLMTAARGEHSGMLVRRLIGEYLEAAGYNLLPPLRPGWRVLPVEPTIEMLRAGAGDYSASMQLAALGIWRAMVSAAPSYAPETGASHE